MVHALHEIHRVLRPDGLLIDARPDSRILAQAQHLGPRGWRTIGTIATSRRAFGDDHSSDRAIAAVKREGLFRSRGAGRFWQRVEFPELDAFQTYLNEHLRHVHRARWSVDAPTRRRWRAEPFALWRAVRYELLERVGEK